VVIPAVNARDLMLRAEVAQSIAREGWFHVWPVSTVDEGLALLTGVAPAEIRRRVTRQLQAFHDMALRQSGAR
jgi:predicted ATP-dependent protease